MLAEADSLFSRGMEKDAYEKVSQAVRFYYAHKLGEKRDLSSAELLNILKKENQMRTRPCRDVFHYAGW